MTHKPPLLSGRQLVKVFKKLGYDKVSQKGSHIKMKNRQTESVIIIPDHKEVDRWTLKTILGQAEIPDEEFKRYL
ncbi:MAG: type II toxin-antitoxin system HicA family toxin [Thermodesulfobacteriota bacterium]|nr:type II toxin-antitoxin system HicA family toxin [Thermodesulfobacteriota bacterium]